jgi:hypothetical protein
MSTHHHHSNEGHADGNPPRSIRGHLHHNWFFYVSGVCLLIALLAFIVSGNLSWQFSASAPQPKPLIGVTK